MNIREKIIIENETKFDVKAKKDFMMIYQYLEDNFEVIPYKNALLYDYYYDTQDRILTKRDISYRIRFRPQTSINLKLPHSKMNVIWSRYEYSCKTDKKLREDKLLRCDCEINREIQKIIGEQDLSKCLTVVGKLSTYRIGLNVYDKQKNALGKRQLIGVAFFDKTTNLDNSNIFYEFEMESYEQTDVYVCPYIFEEFRKLGVFLIEKGFCPSEKSKYYRCIQ